MNNMETFWSTSHAAGAQSSYLESLYESYLENPSSVPDDWKIYFESLPSINGAQQDVSHKEIIERFYDKKSILGVCLGHQAIGEVFGAKLFNLKDVFHGVSTEIQVISDDQLFKKIPMKFKVGRYHSWIVKDLSNSLIPLAYDKNKNVMALKHKKHKVWGVQFHPESILTEYGKEILKNWIDAK